MPKRENLTNKEFGSLKCIEPAPSKNGKSYWLCECKCGKRKIVQTCHLKDGRTKSCGCGYNNKIFTEVKFCEICGKEFQLGVNNHTRKYCYECSPSYKHNESKANNIIAMRKAMKKQAVKIKGGKCQCCGYDKCIGALQFHHRNPQEKKFQLSDGILHPWQDYLEEIEKCDLLCANCHAEKHYIE